VLPFKKERTLFNPQTIESSQIANLHLTPRKCEAWASIFVEMFAQTSFCTYESEPFRATTVFLSSFCEPFFFFLLRKKEEKCGSST